MSDAKIFNVGDTVYIASHGNEQEQKPCPVCFTKREVMLTLGDGTEIMLPCGYCSRGYEPPTGYVSEYVVGGRVTQVTIATVQVEIGKDGKAAGYSHTDNHWSKQVNTFATRDEAQVYADMLSAAYKVEQDTRAEYIKKDVYRSYSWNVGYHRREAKRDRESADRHDKLLVICKERSK